MSAHATETSTLEVKAGAYGARRTCSTTDALPGMVAAGASPTAWLPRSQPAKEEADPNGPPTALPTAQEAAAAAAAAAAVVQRGGPCRGCPPAAPATTQATNGHAR